VNVLLFGATGMIGQGVLRECLLDADVVRVVSIGRSASGVQHPKLREIVRADLFDYAGVDLAGIDACFFCLGVSAAGMSEADYRRVTFDLTLAAATALVKQSPQATFIYVSGEGTGGRAMWARVKGETEAALMRLPFRRAVMFRPGFIQPLHGATSRTRAYRIFYALTAPLLPLFRRLAPRYVTTTEQVARAMLRVARDGAAEPVLNTAAINRVT
jgi:uncharacterized protein YbjT (DUF2867 family)